MISGKRFWRYGSFHTQHTGKGKKSGLSQLPETLPFYNHGIVTSTGSRENEKTIAKGLYGVLREFDEENVDTIYSESFAAQGIGKAIMNRLEKAAGHQTIPAADIVRRQKYRRILFVSSTDSARGPVAAELLRNRNLKQEYVIGSAGMVVLFPEPGESESRGDYEKRRNDSGRTQFTAV